MWIAIICGLILYKVVKLLFYEDDLLHLDNSSDSSVLLSVASRLEKLFAGKAYVGLKIPDSDSASHVCVDVVLATKSEALLFSVKNISGLVIPNPADATWHLCGDSDSVIPDPLIELRKQASAVESYMEQRGLPLPPHYLSPKLLLPNPKCNCSTASFPPQVITSDQWAHLTPQSSSSSWFKTAFSPSKGTHDSIHQTLNFILSTAPTWDRLELKGNKFLLGDFLEFKGNHEDLHALRNVKRSKVSRFLIQKTSMLGFAHSRLRLLYSPRDYRSQGASASEWKEVAARSNTEVVFQPQNSKKVRKFKLSSIVSLTLSA